jgi:hypothetical protein
VKSLLAIILPRVFLCNNSTLENQGPIPEIDTSFFDVAKPLRFVPFKIHFWFLSAVHDQPICPLNLAMLMKYTFVYTRQVAGGKGDNRHVAQAAVLEELAGLLLDAPSAPLGRRRVAPSPTLPRERGREGWGDRGQGAIGVLAEILVARSVEQVEGQPLCSKLITAEETEMLRSRSTAIQSERTRRRSPRALTSPANWIAPPNSSNFSVEVVLPARPGAK